MARDTESLVLTMSADLRRFEKSMASMAATADRRLTAVERRAVQSQRNLTRIMDDAGRQMVGALRSSLAALAPTLAAAFSTAQVIRYADSYTNLQNRLKAAGLEGERLKMVEDQLFDAANRNGVAIDAVAQMYQRVSQSRQALGASDEQLIALTNGVTAALRVQGVSAEQASGPLLQLGQALGGGTVRAEELNSLLEGTPVILQAAAKGSAQFGGDVAKLSAAIRDGEVSSKAFFEALLTGLPAVGAEAAKLPPTVAQAFQTLDNQLGRMIGQTDSGLSATQRMAQGILLLADNLDTLKNSVVAAATVIGGALAARAVGAAVTSVAAFRAQLAITNAQLVAFEIHSGLAAGALGRVSAGGVAAATSMRGLSGAMAFFGGPIGLAITGVAAAIWGLAEAAKGAERDQEALTEAQQKGADILADYNAIAAQTAAQSQNVGAAASSSVPGLNAMCDATDRAAEAMWGLADAQREALRTNALAQIAENRTKSSALRSPGVLDRARDLFRSYSNDGGRTFTYGAAAREAQAAAYDTENARLWQSLLREVSGGRGPTYRPQAGGGGAGSSGSGGRGGGRGASAIDAEARKLDQLRGELDRLTDSLLSDTERAAKDLAEKLGTIRASVSAGLLTGREGQELEATVAGWGLQRPEAQDIQPLDYSAPALADMQALYDEQGRNMAASFVGVLRSNNIAEELGYRFRQAAFDQLEQVLSGVFSGLFKHQAEGGGNWLSAIGSAIAGTFGKRATGGGVVGGQAYITGERRAEVFVPHTSGTIIPSVQAAMGRVQQARTGPQDLKVSINLEGANGDETIRQIAYEAAAQGVAVAVTSSRSDMQTAQRRASRRFV